MCTRSVVVVLISVVSSCFALPAMSSDDSLCKSTEQVVFTCTVGDEVISLCGVPGQSLQFRLGLPGKPLVSAPKDAEALEAKIHTGSLERHGGKLSYVRLEGESAEYVLYDADWPTLQESGSYTIRDGSAIEVRRCTERHATLEAASSYSVAADSASKAQEIWNLCPHDDTAR